MCVGGGGSSLHSSLHILPLHPVTACCVPCYKTRPSVSMVNTRLGPGACSSRLSSKTGCRKQRPTANCSARHQPLNHPPPTHPPTHSTLLYSTLHPHVLFFPGICSLVNSSQSGQLALLLACCPPVLLGYCQSTKKVKMERRRRGGKKARLQHFSF